MIRYLTAGESHGQALAGILEGMPAGLGITETEIAVDLRRRQQGYGRGARMQIEHDTARILAGVRYGETLGSPIALLLENKDWPNWRDKMRVDAPESSARAAPLTTPRPGHADYAGSLKYLHAEIRNVIERSSARETAMRVALGAICRKFLREFGVEVGSHVTAIGGAAAAVDVSALSGAELNGHADANPVRCLDEPGAAKMIAVIDAAQARGDTVGGIFEVVVTGLPPGLGSYAHPDRRLDALLAAALLSVPAVKSMSVGLGDVFAARFGSEVHDELFVGDSGTVRRETNHAGGIEGGMSNGMPLILRAAMKPLSTLNKPLATVDLATGRPAEALRERSDVCAVPAAAVVAEAATLLALMNPFLEKTGGDSLSEIRAHFQNSPRSPWPASS